MKKRLAIGKIPDKDLTRILGRFDRQDKSVVLGPKIGEDAGVIDIRNKSLLAVCVDPILVNIKNAPYYAINVNDIVTRGAIPRYASSTVFFPPSSTLDDVENFFNELYHAIAPFDISIVTGHTEVTPYVKNPGIVLTMFGEIQGQMITTSGAKAGDLLILTKGAGIEGTAIIADNLSESIKDKLDPEVLKRARKYIYNPGISIFEDAKISWKYKPHALHDPTEGGVRKGIEELAIASNNGVEVYLKEIPINLETKTLCELTGYDPLGIFGSGALLISIDESKADELLEDYRKEGIKAKIIGRVTKEKGRHLISNGIKKPLTASHTDGLIGKL